MSSIEHPPLASERALYASLVEPAPEPHDPRTCELCTALRGEHEPIPFRLSEVGPMVESLEQGRLARVADGPVSLLPPPREP